MPNLRGTDLELADLRNADLRNADLRNTKLGGAKLSSTTKLDGAKFGCINDPSSYLLIYPFSPSIKCTNFTKAVNLTPEQVKSAENWNCEKRFLTNPTSVLHMAQICSHPVKVFLKEKICEF